MWEKKVLDEWKYLADAQERTMEKWGRHILIQMLLSDERETKNKDDGMEKNSSFIIWYTMSSENLW